MGNGSLLVCEGCLVDGVKHQGSIPTWTWVQDWIVSIPRNLNAGAAPSVNDPFVSSALAMLLLVSPKPYILSRLKP